MSKTLSTPTPSPTEEALVATRVDDDTWNVVFLFNGPAEATVRAVASDGQVLEEREVAFEWKRVGGSERCGGPQEAEPITLDIQS